MYIPLSQVELNLTSNGDLVYKDSKVPYFGTYFATSKGKYYTNSPGNTILRELTKAIPEEPSDQQQGQPGNFGNWVPDKRFEGYNNTLYSYLKEAPQKAPIMKSPKYYYYSPNDKDYIKGYSTRFFAKKFTSNLYIEISPEDFKRFRMSSPEVAFLVYGVKSLTWYLNSNSDISVEELNLNNIRNFERNNNWPNFLNYLSPSMETLISSGKYTKGNEFLYPNRTNYIGYYHVMANGTIMTGKTHGDGPEIKLIPLKPSTQTLQSLSSNTQPTQISSLSSGGGGGY